MNKFIGPCMNGNSYKSILISILASTT